VGVNPATWMTDHHETLKDRPFSQITLFGSHDSGMSKTVSDGVGSLLGSVRLDQRLLRQPGPRVTGTGVSIAWAGTDDDHSLNTAQLVLPASAR
jgi:hypothetical protein